MARSPNPEAFAALQQAALGWRRREVLGSPLQQQHRRLLAWLEARYDLEEPVPFDRLALAHPQPAGRRLLMPGDPDPWHVRLRLHTSMPAAWLPLQPLDGIHISRTNPVELLWHAEAPERKNHCGALVLLQAAAAGEASALAAILRRLDWPAAAALVERLADGDNLYEFGSGAVPREAPSPRRLLEAAFADRPQELAWLQHLADGGDHWDSGPAGQPVPRGEARLPGHQSPLPHWIGLC